MTAVLLKLAEQLNSSVFILILIAIAAGYGLFKLGDIVRLFKHHEQKIDTLAGMNDKVTELKIKVDLIYHNTNPLKTVQSFSPVSLTDIGKDISAKVSATTVLEKYLPKLETEVQKADPRNAYDIQMASMDVVKTAMMQMLNADEINTIKQEAYSRGILVDDIMSIFGVLLRDRILNKKGLPVSDVDVYAKQ